MILCLENCISCLWNLSDESNIIKSTSVNTNKIKASQKLWRKELMTNSVFEAYIVLEQDRIINVTIMMISL